MEGLVEKRVKLRWMMILSGGYSWSVEIESVCVCCNLGKEEDSGGVPYFSGRVCLINFSSLTSI